MTDLGAYHRKDTPKHHLSVENSPEKYTFQHHLTLSVPSARKEGKSFYRDLRMHFWPRCNTLTEVIGDLLRMAVADTL